MLDGWRKARSGTRQIVVLRGEAGIGKSALVGALKEHVARDAGVMLEGDCSPYYRNSAFYALTQVLSRWSGFASTDAPANRQRKLESALGPLALADAAAVPLMASLLSIPVDAEHPVFKLWRGSNVRERSTSCWTFLRPWRGSALRCCWSRTCSGPIRRRLNS